MEEEEEEEEEEDRHRKNVGTSTGKNMMQKMLLMYSGDPRKISFVGQVLPVADKKTDLRESSVRVTGLFSPLGRPPTARIRTRTTFHRGFTNPSGSNEQQDFVELQKVRGGPDRTGPDRTGESECSGADRTGESEVLYLPPGMFTAAKLA